MSVYMFWQEWRLERRLRYSERTLISFCTLSRALFTDSISRFFWPSAYSKCCCSSKYTAFISSSSL